MTSPDQPALVPTTAPEPAADPVVQTAAKPEGKSGTGPSAIPRPWMWALVLSVGLAAGLIAWACGEAARIPETGAGTRGGNPRTLPSVLASRNAMVCFAILGGTLGLSLGWAGGMVRRSVPWASLAAILGLVLGGLTGLAAAQLTLPIYYEHLPANQLTDSLLVHGGTWTALGGAAGLAFGLGMGGSRRTLRCMLGGAAAALLAALIYEFIGVTIFPLAMTDRPLARSWTMRLLAPLLVGALAASGAVLGAGRDAWAGAR
jgi:hypothetical protein